MLLIAAGPGSRVGDVLDGTSFEDRAGVHGTSASPAGRQPGPAPRHRAPFDARIAILLTERERDPDLLDTIPGGGHLAAEVILAETGGDMTPFATAQHLASRIGVCPGQNESARVNTSGRNRHGNSNLKRLLGVAAMAAIRNKDSKCTGRYVRPCTARHGRPCWTVMEWHGCLGRDP
ncbi:transposase [Streptomyces sp. NPDC060028]|uniref:transposase n=1 Tax=Streptomyces sp. NPDC060028 TaxID=3347041 RepID=UPI0036B81A3E